MDCFEKAELKGLVTGGGIGDANDAPNHEETMKKLLLILLSGVLLCSLSGCRQNQKEMTQVETNITERSTNGDITLTIRK